MNFCIVVTAALSVLCQPESPNARWKELYQDTVKCIRDGDYDNGAFQGRLALRAAHDLKDGDTAVAETMIELARIDCKQGSYIGAHNRVEELRKRLNKSPGERPDLEARAWNVQAEALAGLGQREEAVDLAVKAYKIRLKKFGAGHLETVESVDTLVALGRAHDIERGENFIVKSSWNVEAMSLKVREKLLGELHPECAPSYVAMARARLHDADAEKYLRQALKLWAKLNPRHPELAETWSCLGRHLRIRGEIDDAEHALQQALKLWRYHDDSGWPPPAARGLLELALLRGQQRKLKEADKLYREALEHHFFWVPDDDLCGYFAKTPFDHRSFGSDATTLTGGEALLHEMMRRGGPVIEKALARRAQELIKKRLAAKGTDDRPRNLEVLTALRRLQKSRDPVTVEIKNNSATLEAIFPNIPDLAVALVNQDEKRASIAYQAGGDYRTGRLERWRIEVRDAKGNFLPVIDYLSAFGGGLTQYAILKPGQKWEASLHVPSYVRIPPGDYLLRVQYHDVDSIAGLGWVGGRIVCQSDEIRLHVQPRVIDLAAEERKAIQHLLDKLNGKDPLHVLEGPYSKEHHRLIPPDSPQGRLLALGWKAVPQMIDEVVHEATAPRQRTWLLSLLFTTTTYHDPRHENGILPDWNGPGQAVSNSKVDHAKQLEFARRWEEFRKYIVVRGKR